MVTIYQRRIVYCAGLMSVFAVATALAIIGRWFQQKNLPPGDPKRSNGRYVARFRSVGFR